MKRTIISLLWLALAASFLGASGQHPDLRYAALVAIAAGISGTLKDQLA